MLYEFICLSGKFGLDMPITLVKFQNLDGFIYVGFILALYHQHRYLTYIQYIMFKCYYY